MKPTFADFDLPKQLHAALEKLHISEPTPIQWRSFSPILSGRDIMGIAQTGTGKTLAYLLPLLKEYKYSKSDQPKILILVPTRELVVQVTQVLEKLTEDIAVRVLGVYGGVNINTQKLLVYEGVDILVGTPGRVMDLAIDNAISLKEVQKLIVDEFDGLSPVDELDLNMLDRVDADKAPQQEKHQDDQYGDAKRQPVVAKADHQAKTGHVPQAGRGGEAGYLLLRGENGTRAKKTDAADDLRGHAPDGDADTQIAAGIDNAGMQL